MLTGQLSMHIILQEFNPVFNVLELARILTQRYKHRTEHNDWLMEVWD